MAFMPSELSVQSSMKFQRQIDNRRKVIHYGNLNSSRKFEFITEEIKSMTGEKGVSWRILNFITPNINSSRKNQDFITPKIFHDGKKVDFQESDGVVLTQSTWMLGCLDSVHTLEIIDRILSKVVNRERLYGTSAFYFGRFRNLWGR